MADGDRLAPVTSVGAVAVGGMTREDAVEAVEAVTADLETDAARTVTIVHGEERWTTSGEELGVSAEVERFVDAAARATDDLGLLDRVRLRWGRPPDALALPLAREVPRARAAELVADIAADVEREPRDATLTWTGAEVTVDEGRDGAFVDRPVATEAVRTAIAAGEDRVRLPVRRLPADVSTDAVAAAAGPIGEAVAAAADRPVRLHQEGDDWSLTPRELGAVPDVAGMLDAALAGDELSPVRFDVDTDELDDALGTIAADVEVAARDATVGLVDGAVTIEAGRVGRALDLEAAAEEVVSAVNAGDDEVVLPVETREPAVTEAALQARLLVVDQAARRVELRRDGEVVRSWPVAVGAGGSPTPTGVFTVGAKRHEPTWHNPAPDGWGRHLPASVGPGPDNPLGARALNWEQDGADTLIRFHGTPDTASIGTAASQGCVRMHDEDVIELSDLVPSGTPIVSIAG